MATNPPGRQVPKPERSVIQWLLDSDPSMRWQVTRDLTHALAEEVAAERARASRAAGTHCGPCECWTGIPRATGTMIMKET